MQRMSWKTQNRRLRNISTLVEQKSRKKEGTADSVLTLDSGDVEESNHHDILKRQESLLCVEGRTYQWSGWLKRKRKATETWKMMKRKKAKTVDLAALLFLLFSFPAVLCLLHLADDPFPSEPVPGGPFLSPVHRCHARASVAACQRRQLRNGPRKFAYSPFVPFPSYTSDYNHPMNIFSLQVTGIDLVPCLYEYEISRFQMMYSV